MIRRANVNAYFIEKSERKSSFELEVAKEKDSVGKGKLDVEKCDRANTCVVFEATPFCLPNRVVDQWGRASLTF